jgi:WD40 repeat protein
MQVNPFVPCRRTIVFPIAPVSVIRAPLPISSGASENARAILAFVVAWDIPSGKQRFSLTASGDIDLIIPDPSSATFATVTHGRLTVWDATTGARLAQLPDAGYLRSAAFSPDGRYLLPGYDEHTAALWLWRSGDLRDQACARLTNNLSHDEWKRWFPKQRHRQVCPNLPIAN